MRISYLRTIIQEETRSLLRELSLKGIKSKFPTLSTELDSLPSDFPNKFLLWYATNRERGISSTKLLDLSTQLKDAFIHNRLPKDLKDVSTWHKIPIEKFEDILAKPATEKELALDSKYGSVKKLYDDGRYAAYYPVTYEEMLLFSKDSKWCIRETRWWASYRVLGIQFVVLVDKKTTREQNPLSRIAMAYIVDGKKIRNEAFNTEDNEDRANRKLTENDIGEYHPWDKMKPVIEKYALSNQPTEEQLQERIKELVEYRIQEAGGVWTKDGWVVEDNLYLSDLKLKSIPVKIYEVSGDFDCSLNQLTSLEGAPQSVGGHFDCAGNQLTSLQGAPRYLAGGSFYCYRNQLTALSGAPQSVGGNFDCSSNPLDSLQGAPQSVGGYFDCQDNRNNKKRFTYKDVEAVCNVNGSIFI